VNGYVAGTAALETLLWISMIATTILTGTVYLCISLVTHSSGTKGGCDQILSDTYHFTLKHLMLCFKKQKKKKKNATNVKISAIFLPFFQNAT